MEYWNQPAEDVREEFGTGPDGLQDARVRKIRETSGENILAEGKKKSILMVFLSQFCDLLIVILLIAGIIQLTIPFLLIIGICTVVKELFGKRM